MRNVLFTAGLACTLLGASGVASAAASATSNLLVTATVAASCSIDASAGLPFGTYDPVGTHKSADLDAEGTISTTCTNKATATITLGQGANADAASTDATPVRRMLGGTDDYLSYEVFTDGSYGTMWDNTTGKDVTGTGAVLDTTVYGRIPAGQNVPAHAYSDTVIATITF
jgi:spore coat protein U-like protein